MKDNELGRSMIEMLGVLAIIGVLSVGGIAGYSKAMSKYRVNKTIDQVSHIISNIRVLFTSQKSYKDLGKGMTADDPTVTFSLLHQANLVPDEMIVGNTNTYEDFVNPYGGHIDLWTDCLYNSCTNPNSGHSHNSFVLQFMGIPQDACIMLATLDWNASVGSGMVALGVNAAAGNKFLNYCVSSMNANSHKAITCVQELPMSVGAASAACKKGSDNYLIWKVY